MSHPEWFGVAHVILPLRTMYRHILQFACFILFATSCQEVNHEKMIADGIASGIRHDTMFYGYYFGMPRLAFFQHSLELNSKGIMTNGPENNSILITLPDDGYKNTIDMNLYPDFFNEKVWRMKVWFNYQAWAPWNYQYHADKCLPDALKYLEKTYKTSFKKVKTGKGQTYWLAIDGNREIMVSVKDEMKVFATITDLSISTRVPMQTQPTNVDTTGLPIWEKAKLKNITSPQ
jgi:hypothetical protein